jgi:hypothetical protein
VRCLLIRRVFGLFGGRYIRFYLGLALGLALATPNQSLATKSADIVRREYNEVVAAVDTLVRSFGGERLEEIAGRAKPLEQMPSGTKLVLYFWADDEAEVFLNGYRLASTRLVPTRVEIPSLYVQAQNRFQAHCWDTDRVESGLMVGLYLEDRDGGLHPVLLSGQRGWVAQNGAAETIYYSHDVPDIPGAEVIWGEGLFGEVWLEAAFSSGTVRQAAQKASFEPPQAVEEKPMDAHEAVSRLVRLEKRRGELERELASYGSARAWPRMEASDAKGLAYSLGQAAPLEEKSSTEVADKMAAWADALPVHYSQLVLREPRKLKGAEQATTQTQREGGEAKAAVRRADYRPPPEKGPGQGRLSRGGTQSVSVRIAQVKARRQQRYAAGALALFLTAYVGVVGRRWWKIYNGKVWRR